MFARFHMAYQDQATCPTFSLARKGNVQTKPDVRFKPKFAMQSSQGANIEGIPNVQQNLIYIYIYV